MWTKIVISAAFSLLLIGCGDAVGEGDQTGPTQSTLNTDDRVMPPSKQVGALPNTSPPSSVLEFQKDLTRLLTQGIPAEKFTSALVDPKLASVSLGTGTNENWRTVAGGRVMFLIQRHLEVLPKSVASNQYGLECDGPLYSGFGAALPTLFSEFEGEAMMMTATTPYGILACRNGDNLNYTLIPSDDPVFGENGLPHTPAKLPL